MNDFTKEELCALLYQSKEFIIKSKEPHDCKLIHKIQSMIDNYCEHKWINSTYCEKCNKSPIEES